MRKIKLVAIIALTFSSYGLKAQAPLVLSLDSAINFAITHNKTLINSKYAIDRSTQKIRETISQGLPQINATIDYANYLGAESSLRLNPMAPPVIIEFNPTSNFKANVSQLVFNGSYFVGIQLSKLAKEISEQSYQKDELNVKEQTIQAYYMILASERILKIVKENKENAQIIFEKTNNLAKAGIIESTDAKKLSIMLASIDNAIKSTERQVQMGYNLLHLQMGISSTQSISLSTSFDEISERYVLQTKPNEAFNLQNNMDFKMISMQSDIAKKQIRLKQSNYLPSLAAFYSHTEKIKTAAFDMTPKDVVGLTLNIPIFSSGQRLFQVNQAKIDYKISENTKELVSQQLAIQQEQLMFTYNNLLEQYITQKENVAIAKEVLDKMKFKFDQGVISSLELTSANNDYLSAESNYTNVILQLLNAELSLRKINSKL